MILAVEKKALQVGLNAVKSGLNKKDPASIFATNIQFIAKNGTLTLVTTNGETYYSWKSTDGVEIEQEGSIAANADKLFSSLPHLPDGKVNFSTESNVLNIKSGKIALELKTVSDKTFGKVEEVKAPISLKGDSVAMFRRILHTLNRDPSKGRMLGLLMVFKSESDSKKVTFTSVSPTRASRYEAEFDSSDAVNTQVILPCFLVDEASKHNLVKLGVSEKFLVATFSNNLVVTTPLMANNFINADVVLDSPDQFKDLTFKRNELFSAVSFIKSLCDKQDMKARIAAMGDGTIEISSYTDAGKFKTAVNCSYAEADKPNFALNSEHLAELLTSLDNEDVELKVGTRLLTYTGPNYKYVTSLYNQG